MTAPTEPETTAVAKPAIPHDVQRMIDERKTRNLVAAKIAGMSWGGALDLEARRALADWGQQHGVDVTTEIHILGSRIYKNADYYINRAQPYVRAGMIAIDLRYINVDKRLDEDAANPDPEYADEAAGARREIATRRSLRIQFNVPESAQSAVLCVVRFPRSGESFPAAKWCGNGSRQKDPIGDANPEATAATRAIRKALKMAVGFEPEIAIAFGEQEDEAVADVEAVVHRSQSAQRELNAATLAGQRQGLRNIVNVPELTAGMEALGKIEPKGVIADPYGSDGDDDSWIAERDEQEAQRRSEH